MFIRNEKRFNLPTTGYWIDEYGIQHHSKNFLDADFRESLGITEIPDPVWPEGFSDETHYRNEIDEAPYVVFTPRPQEQLDAMWNAKIDADILALEQKQARCLREAVLLGDLTRLQAINDEITQLRASRKVAE